MTYTDDCLFCRFAKEGMDNTIINTDKVMAFLDINPAGTLTGHTLVVLKNHYPTIDKVPIEEVCELFSTVRRLVPAVKKVSGAEGINLLQNNGKIAGQAIPHVHVHIIPRIQGDGIRLDENRRKLKPMESLETTKAIKESLLDQ
jgi:histidine triad (HIT) family protein